MEFIIKGPIKENIYNLLRQASYRFQNRDEQKSELIFIHPLERSGYPRFHLFVKIKGDDLIFNLHLDQKRPSYAGTTAHSGEYNGEIVEKEAERIKEFF